MSNLVIRCQVDEEVLKENFLEAGNELEDYNLQDAVSSEMSWVAQSGIFCQNITLLEPEDEKQKYFFRVFKEQNGERQYYHKSTLRASSLEEAEEITHNIASEFYHDENVEQDGKSWLFFGGEIALTVEKVVEISIEEFNAIYEVENRF